MKRVSPLVFLLLSMNCFAQDPLSLSMDEYYKVKKNQQMYQQMVDSGRLAEAKRMYKPRCLKGAKTDAAKAQCECASEIIQEVDGKAFVYDSVMSYQSYMAKVAATEEGNDAEVARLREVDANRDGLTKQIEAVCP